MGVTRLLLCFALLLGCAGANDDDAVGNDDDAVGNDDDSVPWTEPVDGTCPDSLGGGASICSYDLDPGSWEYGRAYVGQFVSWGPGERTFVTADGGAFELTVHATDGPLARLPDLASLGPISLTLLGACDGKGGPWSTALVANPYDRSDLWAAIGDREESFGDWSVVSPHDIETCPGEPCGKCSVVCHPKPVTFTGPRGDWTGFSGQSAEMGAFTAFVWGSWAGEEDNCFDAPMEGESWALVRTGLVR